MPPENLEIVKRGYAAINSGDSDAILEACDPDIVIDDPARPHPTSPDGLHRGLEAAGRHTGDWEEVFAQTAMEPVEMFEAGADTVIVRVRATARGAGSGIVVENERYHVFRLREGKIAAMAVRETRADAVSVAERREPR